MIVFALMALIFIAYGVWFSLYEIFLKADALNIYYINLVIGSLCTYTYIRAAFTDPGVILRP